MKYFLLILLLFPLSLSARGQVEESIQIGGVKIDYNTVIGSDSAFLYYRDDELVLSSHNTNNSPTPNVWLLYKDDVVITEVYDTTGDGEPNAFVELRDGEEVTNVEGEPEAWQRPETVEFEDLIDGDINTDSGGEDLVGDLSSITIPGGGISLRWIIILLVLAGGWYWYYKRGYERGNS